MARAYLDIAQACLRPRTVPVTPVNDPDRSAFSKKLRAKAARDSHRRRERVAESEEKNASGEAHRDARRRVKRMRRPEPPHPNDGFRPRRP